MWSNEWYSINNAYNEFKVEFINEQLKVVKVKEKNDCELRLSQGTLVGVNRGEFGGQLSFVPFDTTQREIKIKRGNVKFVFAFENKTYFIEGLAHMGYSGGALYELDTKDMNFHYKKIIDFEDAPEAFTIYQDKFLIATHERFYVVKDFKKEIVFRDVFWSGLYPNSIAIINENCIFLGMRGGIAKLELLAKDIKFYKYSE